MNLTFLSTNSLTRSTLSYDSVLTILTTACNSSSLLISTTVLCALSLFLSSVGTWITVICFCTKGPAGGVVFEPEETCNVDEDSAQISNSLTALTTNDK